MGYGVGYRTYHVAVVKGHLAKSITPHFPELMEEVNLAFDELIGDVKGTAYLIIFHPPELHETVNTECCG